MSDNFLQSNEKEELRNLLLRAEELASIGSWKWNLKTGEVKWSPEMYKQYGLAPESTEPSFEMAMSFIEEEFHQKIQLNTEEAFETGVIRPIEYRLIPAKGNPRWVRGEGLVTNYEGGKPVEIVGTVTDITEQKLTQLKLEQSDERYRLAAKATGFGLFDWDIVNDVIFWDERMHELYGLNQDAVVNRNEYFFSLVHPDDMEMTSKNFSEMLDPTSDKEFFSSEFKIVIDGKTKHIKTEGIGIRDAEGKMMRITGTCIDITRQKTIEEQLENAFQEVSSLKKQLEEENIYLREEIKLTHNYDDIIFNSDLMVEVLNKVEQVASTDATVLIIGETGTGKELIARAVHNISDRRNRTLVKLNCANLSKELMESELFGHEKGAFTGALKQKVGRFEFANNGTIFLDEIGELPLELQSKLLRVLQEGEFERLGGTETIKVNVRVIAATNRDLTKMVEENKFRDDLYYRLNVFPIHIPSLKERPDDIPSLVHYFVKKYGKRFKREIRNITDQTMKVLQGYNWPGNVRELEHLIERALILSPSETLVIDLSQKSIPSESPSNRSLKEEERKIIVKALKETQWKINGANGTAKLLDMAPSTLRDKMKKLGISRPKNG